MRAKDRPSGTQESLRQGGSLRQLEQGKGSRTAVVKRPGREMPTKRE